MSQRKPKPKKPQTQRIILDIEEEETSTVTGPDDSEMLTGVFTIRISSDLDSAMTVDMLLAAYMDMTEYFLDEHDSDPESSPAAAMFVEMHRRLFALATEITSQRTEIINDMEDSEDEGPER